MIRTLLYIATSICIVATIGACDRAPRDREYYMAHPDEAKSKLDACNEAMRKSMTAMADPECAAAGNALESIAEKERVKRQKSQKQIDFPMDSWNR